MAEAVRITAGRASLEASGGLTLERAREVAETGVDFISVGALTHSVKVFDIGLDLEDRWPPRRRHRQQPHRAGAARRRRGEPRTGGSRPTTRRTADEWAVLLRGLLGERSTSVDGIAVCATVPAVLHEWRDDAGGGTSPTCRSVVVEPGVRTGVPVLMDNPREVGTDRIINALAAVHEYGGPAIVVDFGGTATTFDVVSRARAVRRRRDRPRNRDLARGARPPRRPAAQGRIGSGRAR